LSNNFPILIGDIGGTNARFRVLKDHDSLPVDFPHTKTKDYASIDEAIVDVVLKEGGVQPRTVMLAAAGPITPDGLDLTNCHWNIKPTKQFDSIGVTKVILFNDFDAQAMALPHFSSDQLETIGDAKLNDEQSVQTKAVLGPGTGLGVAALLRAGDQWVTMGGEGGHVDLGPRSAREADIWENLERFEGRVSAESIICGSGLLNLFNAICKTDSVPTKLSTPSEVSASGMESSNPQAVEALEIFCATLGRVAGDLALTTMAKGGVYLGGGIAAKILPFIAASGFRAAFEDKAHHSELLKAIPTHVVTAEVAALDGLAAFAREPELYSISLSHRMWQR